MALWAVDTDYAGRGNALFVMPTQNQMDDFAQARFDRAIQDSSYLRGRLQSEPPRRKGADSKRLKRLGDGYLYLRGADSRRQMASVDADYVILDEFDQMGDGTLDLARKRLASSAAGRLRIASTPRFSETGVNALFLQSDQRRYYLPCPACGTEQALTWEDNVDQERALVVCHDCRAPMNLLLEGAWRAEAPGGGLSLDEIDRCRRDYTLEEYAGQPCDMGVDVGAKLHVVIREHVYDDDAWPEDARRDRTERAPRLWFARTVEDFDDLDDLMERFNVCHGVIDALPETRMASDFVRAGIPPLPMGTRMRDQRPAPAPSLHLRLPPASKTEEP